MVGEYSNLAFIIPSSLLVGYAIGYGLDKWLGTHYWYIVWLLIGIVAGMIDQQAHPQSAGGQSERSPVIGVVSLEVDDDGIALIFVCR